MARYLFDCFKAGHKPMRGVPPEPILLDGYPHVGRVCRKCRVAYFEQVGNIQVTESSLLGVTGKPIFKVDEEVDNS